MYPEPFLLNNNTRQTNMKHIHAELMMDYAIDAMETDKPWLRWECLDESEWQTLNYCPRWTPEIKYRRKPKTININGHEVPKPYRGEMKDGMYYYMPNFWGQSGYDSYRWDSDHCEEITKSKGLLHLTKEAAIKHTEALLSFTKQP